MKCEKKVIERVEKLDDGSTITTRRIMRPMQDEEESGGEDVQGLEGGGTDPLDVIKRRFDHHPPPNDDTIELHEWIRSKLGEFAYDLVEELPPCRERELAIRYLETAMMWANAAVAREISRRHWQEEDEG